MVVKSQALKLLILEDATTPAGPRFRPSQHCLSGHVLQKCKSILPFDGIKYCSLDDSGKATINYFWHLYQIITLPYFRRCLNNPGATRVPLGDGCWGGGGLTASSSDILKRGSVWINCQKALILWNSTHRDFERIEIYKTYSKLNCSTK